MERKYQYRRKLPHCQPDFKAFFITLSKYQRRVLPESVRQIVIDTCLAGNGNIPVVGSLDRDQRNRQQGREDAHRFPAGKAFVEDHSG